MCINDIDKLSNICLDRRFATEKSAPYFAEAPLSKTSIPLATKKRDFREVMMKSSMHDLRVHKYTSNNHIKHKRTKNWTRIKKNIMKNLMASVGIQ